MKLVHWAAKAEPVPLQVAKIAKARLPTVSRLVTRWPPVGTCVQCWPPSWVAHSCGPNAQPFVVSRNRIWLTPDAPSGAPVTGAWTPYQLCPALSVRATDVQYAVAHFWPGTPPWPMTHPVFRLTNVAEVAAKSAGTGAGRKGALEAVVEGVGDGAGVPDAFHGAAPAVCGVR